jgi:SPP1 family predicted phage head-tail adaptor
MAINIGKFDNRLTIHAYNGGDGTDENGYPLPEYAPVYSCWCRVITMQGSEYFAAAAVQAVNNIRFIIRYTKSIEFTSNMRVEFKGEMYEVVADPMNDNMENKTITIVCRRLGRG